MRIIDTIKLWLGIVSVGALQGKSKSVISVFTKTVEDLRQVNSAALKQIANKEDEIQKLALEKLDLLTLHTQNAGVIDKINQIIA